MSRSAHSSAHAPRHASPISSSSVIRVTSIWMAWITPQPPEAVLQGEYEVVGESAFFEMLFHNSKTGFFSTLLGNSSDWWAVTVKADEKRVIAKMDDLEEAKRVWAAVKDISSRLSNEPDHRKVMIDYIIARGYELPHDVTDAPVQSSEAEKTAALTTEFRSLFKLPHEEVVTSFAASWGLTPGRLYLSNHYLCFAATFSDNQIVFPLLKMKSVDKDGAVGLTIVAQIERSAKEEAFTFSVANQTKAHLTIRQVWDLEMDTALARADLSQLQKDKSRASILRTSSSTTRVSRSSTVKKVNSTKELSFVKSGRDFQLFFHLPFTVGLLSSHEEVEVHVPGAEQPWQGELFISQTLFAFRAEAANFWVLVHYDDVEELKPSAALNNSVVCLTRSIKLQLIFMNLGTAGQIKRRLIDLWAALRGTTLIKLVKVGEESESESEKDPSNASIASPRTILKERSKSQLSSSSGNNSGSESDSERRAHSRRTSNASSGSESKPIITDLTVLGDFELDRVRALYRPLSVDYEDKERVGEQRWLTFWRDLRPFAVPIAHDISLSNFVRQGLPDRYRGSAWLLLSGAHSARRLHAKDYYMSLLSQYVDTPSPARDEIEKDIYRSFPSHPYFQTGQPGPLQLRNVLLAYSWHNEAVGYCQSMNIVCALLLLYMPEEAVFAMMETIAEALMPGYYNRAMAGSMVDVSIFEELIASQLPEISAHFTKLAVPIPAVTMPWLLCLYIGYLPIEISLRVLDVFFCEGIDALFRVGLAIFKIKETEILALNDNYSIMVMLKRGLNVGTEIFDLAFGMFQSAAVGSMRSRRSAHHKAAVVHNVQDDTKQLQLNELQSIPEIKFDSKESVEIYEWMAQLSSEHELQLTSLQVPSIVERWFWCWTHLLRNSISRSRLCRGLWKFLTDGLVVPAITVVPFVRALSKFRKEKMWDKWIVCFNIMDEFHAGELAFTHLVLALDLFTRIYLEKPIGLEPFAMTLFARANTGLEEVLSLDQIKTVAFDSQYIVEYFDIGLSRL